MTDRHYTDNYKTTGKPLFHWFNPVTLYNLNLVLTNGALKEIDNVHHVHKKIEQISLTVCFELNVNPVERDKKLRPDKREQRSLAIHMHVKRTKWRRKPAW
jgi:hypothetical protein